MSYIAEVSRANPGCFLFLIDQSGSMDESFGAQSGKRKADGVADAINRLLQNIVLKCSKSEGVRDYYAIGVIGYGATLDGGFRGPLSGIPLVPVSQVANFPSNIEERSRKADDGAGGIIEQSVKFPVWFEPVCSGATPMCGALQQAARVVGEWITRNQSSYPPIVINITDGAATDGDPLPHARQLTSLATADGPVMLFNCHISSSSAGALVFPDSLNGLHDGFARMLFEMSSTLPDGIRLAAQAEGMAVRAGSRGFAFNADLVDLIRFLDIGTRPSNLR